MWGVERRGTVTIRMLYGVVRARSVVARAVRRRSAAVCVLRTPARRAGPNTTRAARGAYTYVRVGWQAPAVGAEKEWADSFAKVLPVVPLCLVAHILERELT